MSLQDKRDLLIIKNKKQEEAFRNGYKKDFFTNLVLKTKQEAVYFLLSERKIVEM